MMKKYYILIFLIPILIVVAVNEYARTTTKGFDRNGNTTINPYLKTTKKCSWYCHTDTGYCIKHHTNFLKKYRKEIDVYYFKIISLLHKTGDYGLANIIFLVIFFPLLMYVLLVRSIAIQRKINKFRNL